MSVFNGSSFECEGQISPLMCATAIAITTYTQRKYLPINVVYISSLKSAMQTVNARASLYFELKHILLLPLKILWSGVENNKVCMIKISE